VKILDWLIFVAGLAFVMVAVGVLVVTFFWCPLLGGRP